MNPLRKYIVTRVKTQHPLDSGLDTLLLFLSLCLVVCLVIIVTG